MNAKPNIIITGTTPEYINNKYTGIPTRVKLFENNEYEALALFVIKYEQKWAHNTNYS